jgi:hypothetical protein
MGLHDTIQPGFTFLVGVALPYSIHSRISKGQSFRKQLAHTMWRSLVLIALGIFLRSLNSPLTNFTFEDTLTQIGMGYTFAFLLAYCRPKWQWIALGAILFGYWLAWALYPAPGLNFNYAAVGVPADWHFNFTGFAAHWNKNSNLRRLTSGSSTSFRAYHASLTTAAAISRSASFPHWAPCCLASAPVNGFAQLLRAFPSSVSCLLECS